MKKAVAVISILFCGIIVFFSIMGEKLYYSTKSRVEIERLIQLNGMIFVPESGVFHDAGGSCIITVESEQGFSTDILTVRKIRLISCKPDDAGYFGEGYFCVEAIGYNGDPIVVWTSKQLHGGQRVVEE